MRLFLRLWLLWKRFRYWAAAPAPSPEAFGKERHGERPVTIELGFHIHTDGKVYHRQRNGDGDRRIESEETIALVHREYRILAAQARASMKRHALLMRLKALFGKDLASTKRSA